MTDEESSGATADESETPESDTPESGTSPEGEAVEAKRAPKRKSVWVAIPVEFETSDVLNDDGTALSITKPTKYSITECPGGKGQTEAVRDLLASHEVDPTNYEHVLMFRAEPLDFHISTQTIIRF
jgi:hypothetical protein